MEKNKIPAFFFALAAMLFWGFSFIWSSQLLTYYPPVTIIFIRLILSSIFLFSFIRIFNLQQRIAKKDFRILLISALFNPFFYFLFENYGLKYSSPTIAAVIIATIPVFAPLVAWITLRERISVFNMVGIAISFSGVLLMIINSDFSLSSDPMGIGFLFGAVFSALLYSVTLRILTVRYSALNIVAYQNLIGIFYFLPFFLYRELHNFLMVPLNHTIISSFLFLSILASSAAFVCFAHSVKKIGVSKSNAFSNLIPLFTAIFSYLFIGEELTLKKLLGMLVVITGVYLSAMAGKNRTQG